MMFLWLAACTLHFGSSDESYTVATPTFPDDISNPGMGKQRITAITVNTRVFADRCETESTIRFICRSKTTIALEFQPTVFFGYGPWIGSAPEPLSLRIEADNGAQTHFAGGLKSTDLTGIPSDGCMFITGSLFGPIHLTVQPNSKHWVKYQYSTPIGFDSKGKPGVIGHDLGADSWQQPVEGISFKAVIDPSSKWQFVRGSRGFSWKLSAKTASFQAKSLRTKPRRDSMIALWLKQ